MSCSNPPQIPKAFVFSTAWSNWRLALAHADLPAQEGTKGQLGIDRGLRFHGPWGDLGETWEHLGDLEIHGSFFCEFFFWKMRIWFNGGVWWLYICMAFCESVFFATFRCCLLLFVVVFGGVPMQPPQKKDSSLRVGTMAAAWPQCNAASGACGRGSGAQKWAYSILFNPYQPSIKFFQCFFFSHILGNLAFQSRHRSSDWKVPLSFHDMDFSQAGHSPQASWRHMGKVTDHPLNGWRMVPSLASLSHVSHHRMIPQLLVMTMIQIYIHPC